MNKTIGFYSKEIITETADTKKLTKRNMSKINKHLCVVEVHKQDTHVLNLKNMDHDDIQKMLMSGIEIHFDSSHECPGTQLIKLNEEYLQTGDYTFSQKARRSVIMNNFDKTERSKKGFKDTYGHISQGNALGIVVSNICEIPKTIDWILQNK